MVLDTLIVLKNLIFMTLLRIIASPYAFTIASITSNYKKYQNKFEIKAPHSPKCNQNYGSLKFNHLGSIYSLKCRLYSGLIENQTSHDLFKVSEYETILIRISFISVIDLILLLLFF